MIESLPEWVIWFTVVLGAIGACFLVVFIGALALAVMVDREDAQARAAEAESPKYDGGRRLIDGKAELHFWLEDERAQVLTREDAWRVKMALAWIGFAADAMTMQWRKGQ